MSEYNLFAGVDENFQFPPEVRAALLQSLNIRNVGAPMTTSERNALPTADLDPGYYIFNTQTQTFQVWRSDLEEWHDGLDAPGTQKWWSGPVIPRGWGKQDGTSLSRIKYSALFSVIGTTYGGSDTPSHFRLPDTRGRTMIDVSGAHHLGKQGGAESVQLTEAQMPSHQHAGWAEDVTQSHQHTGRTVDAGSHVHGYWWITDGSFNAEASGANGVYRNSRTFSNTSADGLHAHDFWTEWVTQNHGHPFATDLRGGNGFHENMQPYQAGHFIIKY